MLIFAQARPRLVDATDINTGKMVYIKEIRAGSEERRIAELLRQNDWGSDPRNHCVPVLNIFGDTQDPEILYMVMPFLRPMFNPPFESVKEVIDFTDQILEVDHPVCFSRITQAQGEISQGLVFLHEKGIAHRCGPLYLYTAGELALPSTPEIAFLRTS